MKYLIPVPFLIVLSTVGCVPNQQCCVDDDVVKETYIHRYGVEIQSDEWAERGQDGHVVSTLATGVRVTKSYSAGILQGDTTYTFPHGETIERVETYDQGNLVKEVTNYPSGVPMKEIQYLSPREQRITWWYENSTPRAIENLADGLITSADYYNHEHKIEAKVVDGKGTRFSRDPYGLLISSDTIVDGQMVASKVYYPNGAPKELIPYNNGVISGQKKTFYPAGEPNTSEEWSGNQQHGITTIFQNGEKLAEVPYVNGKKEGVEKRYRDGSTVVEEITWRAGQQDGPAYTYVEGSVNTTWFYQGRQVNKANYDHLTNAR